MGAPMGNHNGSGKPGISGRKSAFQELSDAKRLWTQWVDPAAVTEAVERTKMGTGSLEDKFITLAAEGNIALLNKILDRLYPQKMVSSRDQDFKKVTSLDEERSKLDEILKKIYGQ